MVLALTNFVSQCESYHGKGLPGISIFELDSESHGRQAVANASSKAVSSPEKRTTPILDRARSTDALSGRRAAVSRPLRRSIDGCDSSCQAGGSGALKDPMDS